MTTTVAELIHELQQYPEDLEVTACGRDGDFGLLAVETKMILDGQDIIPEENR